MKWQRVQYLTVEDVVAIHDEALDRYGGHAGVLRPSELDAAVMGPRATFAGEPLLTSLVDIAAAYAYYIVKLHPFMDGNKRTGLLCAHVFLTAHGVELPMDVDPPWQDVIAGMADNQGFARDHLAQLFAGAVGDWHALD